MSDDEILLAVKEYATKIMETDIYRKYSNEKERIKKHPDLYKKVNEYRERTFELQNAADQDDLFHCYTYDIYLFPLFW